MEWEESAGAGTVYSWVEVAHPAHPALREFGPYVVALVELDDMPEIKLIAVVDAPLGGTMEIGARVRVVSNRQPSGSCAVRLLADGLTAQAHGLVGRRFASTSSVSDDLVMVLAGSQMLVQLDATIINTALPAIKRAFELSEGQSLWSADAYMW
ncbi:hypothetical protein GBAR_LOCUS25363 [Geodia barretti]|uniref:ChsH2 C-terminal OB-fold domain-containing protein n=1 Tax=Geodia barretti TaxID=519541 RepID=A0AA35TE43_GEOBA|nr:hypothetical protein GBAR_LOCUS25363 [Geodia barretti]